MRLAYKEKGANDGKNVRKKGHSHAKMKLMDP